MPRNANGVYTLPAVPTSTVDADWFNLVLNDIAQALTDSFAVAGSITPDDLTDNPVEFQQKLGVDTIIEDGLDQIIALESRNSAEIGVVFIRAVPDGFVPDHSLPCDGSLVSRTTYAKLFAKVGTTFGAGDGTTTFGLPDMRDRLARGWDNGRGVDSGRALGSVQTGMVPAHTHTASTNSTGSHSHTATTNSTGAHTHTGSTSSDGGHTHTWSGNTGNNNVGHTHTFSATTNTQAAHTHTLPYNHMSMFDSNTTAVASNGTGYSASSSTAGAHTHSVSGTTAGVSVNHTHTYTASISSAGGHTHAISITNAGAHTHTTSSASAGAHTHTVTVDNAGGESRVRNVASRWFIKFE